MKLPVRRQNLLLLLALAAGLMFTTVARAQTPDPAAVQLVNNFVQALQIDDEAQRVQAVLPFMHRSQLTEDGKDLLPEVKGYPFKKASRAAKSYQVPATVSRIKTRGTLTVGEGGPNPQKGRIEDYFINKKDGTPGGSLQVFFAADGSAPKIFYMGSL